MSERVTLRKSERASKRPIVPDGYKYFQGPQSMATGCRTLSRGLSRHHFSSKIRTIWAFQSNPSRRVLNSCQHRRGLGARGHQGVCPVPQASSGQLERIGNAFDPRCQIEFLACAVSTTVLPPNKCFEQNALQSYPLTPTKNVLEKVISFPLSLSRPFALSP